MISHTIRRGLDLPLAGAPAQRVEQAAPARQVALLGADTPGLGAALAVQPGDRVLRGQLLYEDRKCPGVRYTAPAEGTVRAVHRGDRRSMVSVVIDVDEDAAAGTQVAFAGLPAQRGSTRDAATVRSVLLEAGLWSALRTRPFSRVPEPGSVPQAIFVTAIDTHPLAPDPDVVLAGREPHFHAGMAALEQLTAGPVLLCRAPGSRIAAGANSRAEVHEFAGPHPAGTVGVHIHLLHPVDADRIVWHIGYQDVAAIGHLLETGRLDVERVVSLAGPGVARPRLLRTRLGASIADLTRNELHPGAMRVLSGSVLAGRSAGDAPHGFLGRFHQQVCALPEFDGRAPRLFAGLRSGSELFSGTRAFASAFRQRRPLAMTTSTHGPRRPMLPVVAYDRVLPFDLEPVLLLRALLARDLEQVERLGGLELDEEDLALATLVCPGKHDYGVLLRESLDQLRGLVQ